MSSVEGASSWIAAIAAWSWYGPIGASASVALISAVPSSIARRSQTRSILLGERDQGAVVADAGRPAGVGQEHQREQTGDLAVVGQEAPQLARQPDPLRAQLDPLERRTRARGVALVEDQVQDVEHGAEPVMPFRGRGHR